MNKTPPPVDQALVLRSLVRQGLASTKAIITPLSGGVSSDVWLVSDGETRLVAKSPLAKLRTPADWFSDISRGQVEFLALKMLSSLTPQHVPKMLFFDESLPLVVMTAAPQTWVDWREALLSRHPQTNQLRTTKAAQLIGATLGQVLATWHSKTFKGGQLPEALQVGNRLKQLRTDPFHRASAPKMAAKDLSVKVLELAEELESVQACLAYGDYSPKNVLVGKEGLWVIDAETAHLGHPVIDTAFLSAHLILKSIHRPDLRGAMLGAWLSFVDAYQSNAASKTLENFALSDLAPHTGAILAARVLGVSPAKYLTDWSRAETLTKAERLLRGTDIFDLWQ